MNPILTDASLDVPSIRKSLSYLEEQFINVLNENGEANLAKEFHAGTPSAQPQLSKVYSLFFQLLNVAEELSVTHHRDKLEGTEGIARVSGLWGHVLQAWKQEGLKDEDALARLKATFIEPVFTAHPTESKRTTVLEQLNSLFDEFSTFQNTSSSVERRQAERRIGAILHRLWLTGDVYLAKPTVNDELRNIIHYLSNTLPQAVECVDQRLIEAWESTGWESDLISSWKEWPTISFGNWVGGDRDGHPFVTNLVTTETFKQLRQTALVLVRSRLVQLAKQLSFSETMVPPSLSFVSVIQERAKKLGASGEQALTRNSKEPWRQWLNLLIVQLPILSNGELVSGSHTYQKSAELVNDLSLLMDELSKSNAAILSRSEILPVIRIVQTFGFHLAKLDIRQNSQFHDKALSQLMQAANIRNADTFANWSETDRIHFLVEELRSPRPFTTDVSRVGDEAKQVVSTLQVLGNHIHEYGIDGIGSLIVSMTRQTSDLLVVYLLAREAGLIAVNEQGWYCPIQVVPLFETIDDLHRSEGILESFLANSVTARYLKVSHKATHSPRQIQQVMIGYSDSNKDGGIFSSLWALQQAQRRLVEIGKRHNTNILFFHGRGGSVSRGAGPTHRFIAACPSEALVAGFRQTEQGEVIAQKYARIPTAVYNLEAQLAGVAKQQTSNDSTDEWFENTMEWISEQSRQAYEKLLFTPRFIDFFAEATPLAIIELSGIGSRPARRTGQRTLADLRAIPWVFSWSQSRFYLPAWYGVGSALAALKQNRTNDYLTLQASIHKQPGLHYILTNVSSALMLSDTEVMNQYSMLVQDTSLRSTFMELILPEFELTKLMVQEFMGMPLDQRRPGMHAMMLIRNEKLQVLHKLQIQEIIRWREFKQQNREDEAQALLPALLQTVNAIACGLRATG